MGETDRWVGRLHAEERETGQSERRQNRLGRESRQVRGEVLREKERQARRVRQITEEGERDRLTDSYQRARRQTGEGEESKQDNGGGRDRQGSSQDFR